MGTFIEVSEASDPRLADYVALRDSRLRRRLEAAEGLFIAEGDKIIRRAVEAGYRPRSLLLAPRWIPGLSDLLDPLDVPVYVVSESLAEELTGFHVHRGALASVWRGSARPAAGLLHLDRLVVCEDIVDHANLGAIVRNAAGLGWDGVLVSARSADPLYRRAIKASMGTVFGLPWARLDAGEGPALLREAGFEVVASSLGTGAVALDDYAAEVRARGRRIALLVGSEGPGLTGGWLDAADVRVTIPMARGVDSLNVAAATAILCHALAPAPVAQAGAQ
ncbi:MAG TPA: RNA methyltransferase [Propionibacteriaceae bacterium]|nr:RNA methyltransferase [Propionibacteriaceae bacterium]